MPTNRKDYPKIQFAATEVADKIQARTRSTDTSIHIAARRDLRRYYELLEQSRPTFSEAEAHFLVDIFNGTHFDPIEMSATMLWASVEDAPEATAEKHGIDRGDVVGRLRTLSFAEGLAVIDAVERFWNDDAATVRSVGLVE